MARGVFCLLSQFEPSNTVSDVDLPCLDSAKSWGLQIMDKAFIPNILPRSCARGILSLVFSYQLEGIVVNTVEAEHDKTPLQVP